MAVPLWYEGPENQARVAHHGDGATDLPGSCCRGNRGFRVPPRTVHPIHHRVVRDVRHGVRASPLRHCAYGVALR